MYYYQQLCFSAFSDTLQQVTTKVIGNAACKAMVGPWNVINQGHLCTNEAIVAGTCGVSENPLA